MNPAKTRTLREIPLGTRIHDPWLALNLTNSEVHVFINRDLNDRHAPRKVTLRPDQYFDFPHMNYSVYREDVPGEPAHGQLLKGREREAWLKRIPKRFTEGKTETVQ